MNFLEQQILQLYSKNTQPESFIIFKSPPVILIYSNI